MNGKMKILKNITANTPVFFIVLLMFLSGETCIQNEDMMVLPTLNLISHLSDTGDVKTPKFSVTPGAYGVDQSISINT